MTHQSVVPDDTSICGATTECIFKACKTDLLALLQITELKLKVETVERERDFYFDKLRDIEILCQAPELQTMPIVKIFERILVSSTPECSCFAQQQLSNASACTCAAIYGIREFCKEAKIVYPRCLVCKLDSFAPVQYAADAEEARACMAEAQQQFGAEIPLEDAIAQDLSLEAQ